MNFEKINILGIMSGTSLDGVDLALVEFQCIDNKWFFDIQHCKTYPYNTYWFDKLKLAVLSSAPELKKLNQEYTKYLNALIHKFISDFDIQNLDAIASHGHTIFHKPQEGYTLQIGNLPSLKNGFDIPIVCDFRVQDVKLGGQGAPLVPIGDRFLFSDFDFCLNLGGFSNISFDVDNKRIAYDISPVNTVLNFYANQLGLDYDDKGAIARLGIVHLPLLQKLNENDFYSKEFPKSLGFEFVLQEVFPVIDSYQIAIPDILATYVAHVSDQISNQLKNKKGKMLVTGGGAFNLFLIEELQKKLPAISLIIPDVSTINFKEALIFAFLGVLKLNDFDNVLASVTGAKTDHSSGVIF